LDLDEKTPSQSDRTQSDQDGEEWEWASDSDLRIPIIMEFDSFSWENLLFEL